MSGPAADGGGEGFACRLNRPWNPNASRPDSTAWRSDSSYLLEKSISVLPRDAASDASVNPHCPRIVFEIALPFAERTLRSSGAMVIPACPDARRSSAT